MGDLRPVTSVEPLVDREGIAQYLGVSPGTVDKMRAAGMPEIKWGRRLVRFAPSECLRWWRDQQKEAA